MRILPVLILVRLRAWAGRTLDSRRVRRGTRQRAPRHELLACQRRGAHHVQFQVALEAIGLYYT